MKNTNLFRMLCVAICLSITTIALAEKEGGGGNADLLKFTSIANRAVKLVKEHPSVFPEIDFNKFKNTVESTKIIFSRYRLKVGEEQVDAINYPDKNEIHISRNAWRSLNGKVAEQVGLIMHEFLGVMKISDENYRISSKVMDLLNHETEPFYRWSCSASIFIGSNLFQIYGDGSTSGEAWSDLNNAALAYMEDNRRSGYQLFVAGDLSSAAASILNSCLKN